MSRTLPRSSRRSALGLGLAVVVAGSGCTPSNAPTGSLPPTAGTGATGRGADAVADADPDTALVAQVLDEVSQIHARVQANRRAHRRLTQKLRRLERMHARHARELGGLIPVSAAAPAEKRAGKVVARLGAAEVQLQRRLARASISAESGALALLLAAMAAAIAQERTRL